MWDRGLWVRYEPPTREAIILDLQAHRQAGVPLTAGVLRQRHALFHAPAVVGVLDFDRRADVVAAALSDAITHQRLTPEQQIIARWMLSPSPDLPEMLVNERRLAAVDEIAATLTDRHRRPMRLTARQVEDRESRILGFIADLLREAGFAERRIAAAAQPTDPQVPPPSDPYMCDGFEWVASAHHLTLFDEPGLYEAVDDITIRAHRRGQRLFQMLTEGIPNGEWELVDTSDGQRLLEPVAESRPTSAAPNDLIVVHLGRALKLGETARVALRVRWRDPDAQNPLGLHGNETAGQKLLLTLTAPASANIAAWSTEIWDPSPERLIASETYPVAPGESVHAVFDTVIEHPLYYYRLTWQTRS